MQGHRVKKTSLSNSLDDQRALGMCRSPSQPFLHPIASPNSDQFRSGKQYLFMSASWAPEMNKATSVREGMSGLMERAATRTTSTCTGIAC